MQRLTLLSESAGPIAREFATPLLRVLGHSLWQAALISVVLTVLLRAVGTSRSRLRYMISGSAMLLLVISVLATWTLLRPATEPDSASLSQSLRTLNQSGPQDAGQASDTESRIIGNVSWSVTTSEHPAESSATVWTGFTLAAWSLGVLIMLIRAGRGVLGVQLLSRDHSDSSRSVPDFLSTELSSLKEAMQIRQNVRLLVSDRIRIPAVLGSWWPVILIPANMVCNSSFSVAQWRAILAHELAHIKRLDALFNLAQMLTESFLFFNPGVWWISRRIRAEREACCDAMASEVTGEPLTLARALITVADSSRRQTAASGATLALTGNNEDGGIRDRIQRLASPRTQPSAYLTILGLLLSVSAVAASFAILQAGTQAAVQAAVYFLSPQETVDELARLQAENSGVIVPASERQQDPRTPTTAARTHVPVTVNVTADSDLPKNVNVVFNYDAPGVSGTTSRTTTPDENNTATEMLMTRLGVMHAVVSADGFAPVVSEKLTILPEKDSYEINIHLDPGFPATLQFLSAGGQPIADVTPSVWAAAEQDGLRARVVFPGLKDAKTDSRGMLTIPNATAEMSCEVAVRHPGFEMQRASVELNKDKAAQIELNEALPTRISVRDESTGRPIQGALILLGEELDRSSGQTPVFNAEDPRSALSGYSKRHYRQRVVLGETNGDGNATLNLLSRHSKYRLAVYAEGYQIRTLPVAFAGSHQEDISITPAVTISGQIRGDLSQLHQRRGDDRIKHPVVGFRNDFSRGDNGSTWSSTLYARVDREGRFTIGNLSSGSVTFYLAGQSIRVPVVSSRDNVELELPSSHATSPIAKEREVIVSLTGLPPDHPVRGRLRGHWQNRQGNGTTEAVVTGHKARLLARSGSRLSFRPDGLIGCSISEDQEYLIDNDDGPIHLDIPAVAAGGVHGRVLREEGDPATYAHVYAIPLKKPQAAVDMDIEPSSSQAAAMFFKSLPLGGEYLLLAREFHNGSARWAVSEPFELNEELPIREVRLTIGKARPYRITVRNAAGNPVPDVPVRISISHTMNSHSRSASVTRSTGEDGVAHFPSVMLNENSGPFQVRGSVTINPVHDHVGFSGKLTPEETQIGIQLQRGVVARGILINDLTDGRIPNAEIRIYPSTRGRATFYEHQSMTTDDDGEFTFTTLEPVIYKGHVEGGVTVWATVDAKPTGGYQISYPNGNHDFELRGGDEIPVIWRVQPLPGGSLQPAND